MKRKRIILCIVVTMICLAVWVGLRALISSRVHTALSNFSRGDLAAVDVEVGWTASVIKGLTWRNSANDQLKWLSIKQAEVDIGIWSVLCGQRTPGHVTLTAPHVDLQLDGAGRLLTKIRVKSSDKPTSLPQVVVRSGSLVITQDAKTFAANHIAGEFQPESDGAKVEAKLQSSDLGEWAISAAFAKNFNSASVVLKCDQQNVDSHRLRAAPLVHRWIPKPLTFAGKAAAEIKLSLANGRPLEVDSVIQVGDGAVDFAQQDRQWNASRVAGRLEINNQRLQFLDVTGSVLDAFVKASGTVPFKEGDQGEAEVEVARLAAETFARDKAVSGNIGFTADVNFARSEQGHDVTASAKGKWSDARVGNSPLQTIPLEWSGRMQFARDAAPVIDGQLKLEVARLGGIAIRDVVVPHHVEASQITAQKIEGWLAKVQDGDTSLGRFRANASVTEEPDRQLQIGLKLQDINTQHIAALAGLSSRIELGTSAGAFEASAPLSRAGELTAWSVTGNLTVDKARLRSLTVSSMEAALVMQAGKLTLKDGTGKFSGGGSGKFGLQMDLTSSSFPTKAEFAITDIDSQNLTDSVPPDFKLFAGPAVKSASGKLVVSFKPLRWSGDGKVASGPFSFRGVEATSFAGEWTADPSVIRINNVQASIADGAVTGHVTWPLAGTHKGESALTLRDINVKHAARLWPDRSFEAAGKANGSVTFTVSRRDGKQVNFRSAVAWHRSLLHASHIFESSQQLPETDSSTKESGAKSPHSKELHPAQIGGEVTDIAGRIVLSSDAIRVTQREDTGSSKPEGDKVEGGDGSSPLDKRDWLAGGVQEFVADFAFNPNDRSFAASGNVALANLTAPIKSTTATADWRIDRDQLHITRLNSGSDDETTLTGTVSIPLRDGAVGDVSVGFDKLDANSLLAAFGESRLSFGTRLAGSVQARVTGAGGIAERKIKGQLKLEAAQLKAGSLPVAVSTVNFGWDGSQAGSVRHGKQLQVDAVGEVLQGELKANVLLMPKLRLEDASLVLDGAKLDLAADLLGWPAAKQKLRGTFNVTAKTHRNADDDTIGLTGEVKAPDVRWNDSELLQQLTATLDWSGEKVKLTKLQTSIGGGVLCGHASFRPRAPLMAEVHFGLVRADLQKVLAPWPKLVTQASGTVSAAINGHVGRTGTGTGSLTLTRAKFGSMTVARADLPLLWSVDQASRAGSIRVRRGTLELDQGRATASLRYDLGARPLLSGTVNLQGASVRDVAKTLGRRGETASGTMSGRIEFNTRSPADLQELSAKANVSVDWKRTPQMPLIRKILSAVVGSQSSSPGNLNHANVRARLDRGTLTIDRLDLTGKNIQVVVLGTVTVRGRLNLRVIADTGQVAQMLNLGMLASRASAKNRKTFGLLSAQLVQLHVTGTMSSPVIRAEPLPQITPGILQSFLPVSN